MIPEILLAVTVMVPLLFFFSNDAYLLIRHLQGDTTTGTGTVPGQYPTTAESHPSRLKQHTGGSHSQGVTGTGPGVTGKASMTDKIVGGVEKVTGKMTDNTGMYQKGVERAVSCGLSSFVRFCSNF
jgi:hypothetical protein